MRTIVVFCVVYLLCVKQSSHQISCPAKCICVGNIVTCKHAGLTQIPTSIPPQTEKLILPHNDIRSVDRLAFSGLRNLKVLQLYGNQISSIENGAFNDLVNLKRLKLNRNNITTLPDGLFQKLRKLHRLDLRQNRIQCIGNSAFTGLTNLKILQLDKNQLMGLSKDALPMPDLMKLTLSNNNLSMLPEGLLLFPLPTKLKIDIKNNPLTCNCHLMWFHNYLLRRQRPDDKKIVCSKPSHLSGKSLTALSAYDFQCSVAEKKAVISDCGVSICLKSCTCSKDGYVNCKQRKLTAIPNNFPANMTELDLSGNQIEIISSKSFVNSPKLKKIYLNSNKISHIADGAFDGLPNLNFLHLNENQIKSISPNLFKGLTRLEILYLHGNNISCIAPGAFRGLTSLGLIHLSKNNIKSLDKDTFQDQKNIFFIYLNQNPLICDCNLKWLHHALQNRESMSNSFASACAEPPRMYGKLVRTTAPSLFKCHGDESNISQKLSRCHVYDDCPMNCQCSKLKIDCSKGKLKSLPDNIPLNTKELILKGNEIEHVPRDSILKKLKNLQKIDLSDNKINRIDSLAFGSLINLEHLDLSKNNIDQVDEGTLRGLSHLQILLLGTNKIKCLNNDTFNQTPALKILQLNDNHIGCIMKDTFIHLKQLKTLSLDNNRLHCNCHLNWMTQWLRKNVHLLTAQRMPICSSPSLLSNTPITTLEEKHFQCVTDTQLGCNNGVAPCCSKDTINCHPRAYCPPKCECEATVVRCFNQNLTEIPSDIPTDTTELYLERNAIQSINASSLSNLNKLHTLILTYNNIQELNAHVFSGLGELRTLTLSYNKIKCIDKMAFKGLKKLKALLLSGNNISSIPYGSFDDLTNLNNIVLSDNPLYCDCNIKWMNDLFRERFLDNGIALCTAPANMKLKSVYHSRSSDFVCRQDESVDEYHKKCNPCYKNPCQNEGQCQAIGYRKYKCLCKQSYHGNNCESLINACFGKPCKNNGTCQFLDNFGNYKCLCTEGFTGPQCTENIDDCVDHNCQNGGVCIDGVANYTCSCPPGYAGDFCEEKFTYCEDVNPCQEGGLCQKVLNGYQCICQKGWTGKNCEINIDDCKYNGCLNGATCVDEVNGYSCECRPGYIGRHCQQFAWSPPRAIGPAETVCTYHSCQHGGRCVTSNTANEYQCICRSGFGGKFCENLHSVHFNLSNSYAVYNPPSKGFLKPKGKFEFEMATNHSTGIILYYGDGNQYLILELYNSRLQVSYSLGNGQVSQGYSLLNINDRTKRLFEIDVIGENVTVSIDNRPNVILKNQFPEDNRYLSVDGPIYIGGIPQNLLNSLVRRFKVSSLTGFGGCIGSMQINEEKINFLRISSESAAVHPGCSDFEKVSNPCSNSSLCRNGGKCVSRMHQNQPSFKCLCKSGFKGKYCERNVNPYSQFQYDPPKPENTCHTEVQHRYIRDPVKKCLSKRKIKLRSCVGSCSQNSLNSSYKTCCVSIRYKIRYIRFSCPNNDKYIRQFKLIRKCGCRACNLNGRYSG